MITLQGFIYLSIHPSIYSSFSYPLIYFKNNIDHSIGLIAKWWIKGNISMTVSYYELHDIEITVIMICSYQSDEVLVSSKK